MVSIDEEVRSKYLEQIESDDDLKGYKQFVENFFYTLSENEPIYHSYPSYLDEILDNFENSSISNQLFLQRVFKDVTNSPLGYIIAIDMRRFHHP